MIALALFLAAAPAGTTAPSALERLTKDIVRPVESFEGPIGVYVEGSPAPASRAIASLVMIVGPALAARSLDRPRTTGTE